MPRTILYGYVTRYPKNNAEIFWETGGYEGENPEGGFRYKFSDHEGWRQPCLTRLDMEYFMSKPNEYKFEPISGRPENMRPIRPTPVEYFDRKVAETQPKIPVVNEMPAIPVEEPVMPKKRMGRPPKAESLGAN